MYVYSIDNLIVFKIISLHPIQSLNKNKSYTSIAKSDEAGMKSSCLVNNEALYSIIISSAKHSTWIFMFGN